MPKSSFMKDWSLKKTVNESMPCNLNSVNREGISTNLFIIGFVSTSVQLLLMREIMNISGGYELITGIFFGSWLIASATGSALAGKYGMNDIRKINLAFSVSPFISLLLLIFLSRFFLESGETPGFLASMVLIFLMLLPFCFFSGFAFVKLISFAKTKYNYVPGRSFSIETTGSILAGILLSVLTSGLLNTGQILPVILILNLAYALLTFFITGKREKFITKCIISVLTVLILISEPDVMLKQMLMPGIKVTETKDTPYGNITRGVYGREHSIFYNQRLLTYSDDAVEREENIHYALLQTENPEKVILISGSLSNCLPELKKYNLKKVIYVESDPGLIKTTSYTTELIPFIVEAEAEDAFRFVRSGTEKADAVILLLPPPSTLALNRYFTTDFFKDVKKRLIPGGVFMCSPGLANYYLNTESVNLYSSVYNSLTEVFRFIKPVVGNKLYFIASDSEVQIAFCEMAEKKMVKNIYVSSDFMSDDLIQRKSDEILSLIDSSVKKNRAAFPVACFYFQSYNLSRDPAAKSIAILILIIGFALSFLTVNRNNIIMYFSALTLAGFEIILLLILQLTIGNMYQLSGIIIASLMAGLAAGSGTDLRITRNIPVWVIPLALLLFYAIVALCLNYILSITAMVPAVMLIMAAGFPPSFITGFLFRKLTIYDDNGSRAASVYSSDLAGSAFGFILISGVLIPVFGIRLSILLLSGLIFAGILFGTNRNK